MTTTKRIASLLGATLLFSMTACSSQKTDAPAPEIFKEVARDIRKVTGDNLSANERIVLDFLQERGIKDKVALATIMGNIRQESCFEPTICEGGSRTGYRNCLSGGFGLIQWTTPSRYLGLGHYARVHGLNPNALETQLRWMVNEVEWKKVEHIFKTEGLDRSEYMNAARRWLGWGVFGARGSYTETYINSLRVVE